MKWSLVIEKNTGKYMLMSYADYFGKRVYSFDWENEKMFPSKIKAYEYAKRNNTICYKKVSA